jgi:hypothetical protein
MKPASKNQRLHLGDVLLLGMLALAIVLYFLLTSAFADYGHFIDELYYIACTKRLAMGYVDHPPLSIFLLAVSRTVFGESLPALRFLPALAIGGTAFLTGFITRRLGGGLPAVALAALAVIFAPIYLLLGSFYSMNPYEILLHTAIIAIVVVLIQEERPRLWLAVGGLFGLGLEMKHTMILYAVAMGIGIGITGTRRLVWNRWFFLGMAIAFLLVLPNLVWQFHNGFPSIEFYRNAMVNKNVATGPVGILRDQVLFINPFALPLWLGGLVYFFKMEMKQFRFVAWSYCVLILIMVVSQSSRPDRIASFYPVLFAGGAVALQGLGRAGLRSIVTPGLTLIYVLGSCLFLPLFTPLLSPKITSRYLAATGLSLGIEVGKMRDPLPQWLGDRLGWREMAEHIGRVAQSLPPDVKQNAVIVSTNYGHAGACELYAKEFGLPPVYSTHNSYHQWGPPPDSTQVFIGVGVNHKDLVRLFDSVVVAAVATCTYCTRPQQRVKIYLARGPRMNLAEKWPEFKIYN